MASRTKLGLGICKGPEWKPGIFVQFTKDKSVAREVGLRPGDQILSVNSIDFSDVLFSEAVAVMKSSNKLEMVIRTAAGCDLFPGESSGYNSSASSVTGDQSPCWADVRSKRLTAVREESGAASARDSSNWSSDNYAEMQYLNVPRCGGISISSNGSSDSSLRAANKTIIKLSENGTSINNTFIETSSNMGTLKSETPKCTNTNNASDFPPPPPPLLLQQEQPTNLEMTKTDFNYASPKSMNIDNTNPSSNVQNGNSNFSLPSKKCENSLPNLRNFDSNKSNATDVGSSLSSAISEELQKRKLVGFSI